MDDKILKFAFDMEIDGRNRDRGRVVILIDYGMGFKRCHSIRFFATNAFAIKEMHNLAEEFKAGTKDFRKYMVKELRRMKQLETN